MTIDLLVAGLTGLAVGSFLCLVAHRLPVMLDREWEAYCAETDAAPLAPASDRIEDPAADGLRAEQTPYNLLLPPSHCPACGHSLSIIEKIPLLSWLMQRGRCRACSAFIGWREPLVEVLAAALAMLAIWRFGLGWDALLTAMLLWMLLLASVIDLQRGWLPDQITQPLLWLGLLANLEGRFVLLEDAVIGAAAGYLGLWVVYWSFRLATRREGLGIGDLHLLAAIGAWAGWQVLPGLVLLAALLGLVWAGVAIFALGRSRADPMPFGPMLSIGGLVAMLWPDRLEGLLLYGLAP
jgi:leader peptidase (prepilin peptidase)/N-methyltransferase